MRARAPAFAVLLLVSLPGLCVSGLHGQVAELPSQVTARTAHALAVPFGPGERLEYDVKVGLARGRGHMEVLGLDSIRGRTTYHVSMGIKGGLIWDQVNDQYQSWFDVSNLVTLRSIQDTHEFTRQRYKHFEIYPEARRSERRDKIETKPVPTDLPLDDVSFFYFVRTLPLEVGQEYTFNRYYKEEGNPVILRVLRIETVEVPAGTFETVVVQPIIKTSGLFGQGGEAELYFSNDERRFLVLMKSKVSVLGSLSLHLRSITEGRPLVPPGGDNAEEVRVRLALPETHPITGPGGSGKGSGGIP